LRGTKRNPGSISRLADIPRVALRFTRATHLSDDDGALRLHLREPVIQGIARAAHGADRVLFATGIEQFAQTADVDVDGAFVDIDVAAPDAVEQLLTAEDAAGMLEEKLQQAIL